MAPKENSHDKLFKLTLANPKDAACELRAVLPPTVLRHINLDSLTHLPGTFVDETMKGAHADLLFSVEYAKEPALLYVLMEHKSEVDRWTVFQLLRYMVRIWERCLTEKPKVPTLRPIIPVIIHHSESGWTAPCNFQGLFHPTVSTDAELCRFTPEFQVALDDISFRSDGELRARAMSPEATLGFLFLRDGRREGRVLEELLNWADLLRLVLAAPHGRRAILQLFSYLTNVAPNLGPEELSERIQRAVPERNDIVTTLAEKWIQEGIEKGIEKGIAKGIEKGRKEGYKALVRRMIELKFGTLTREVASRIDAADEPTLERYSERVLIATRVEDVFTCE